MTTIAWDGETLAADSMVTHNGRVVGSMIKAIQVRSVLAAASGASSPAQAFLDWVKGGLKGDAPNMAGVKDGDAVGIIIAPDGRIVTFDEYGRDWLRAERYSIGSGAPAALAAMDAGLSAEEAVRLVAKRCCYTGGEITVLRR